MQTELYELMLRVAAQMDPNQGTYAAQKGAAERMVEPHYYDVVFPILALFLVIIIPAGVAIWAGYRTIKDDSMVDGES